MEEARLISWTSEDSHLLLNPRLPDEEQVRLRKLASPLAAHLWLATSGTSGALKLVALSKEAMLASADAVNRHLQAGSGDRWCRALPAFHVGGLAIYARAFRSRSDVLELEAWHPNDFLETCNRNGVTLTSLVPAQLRDLTVLEAHGPRSLRAIVVGGASLDADLYRHARRLGWNVLPSYGMTECGSQIATSPLDSLASDGLPRLELLSHLHARTEADGRLAFRGASLLSGYADEQAGFRDPKVDGWFVSDDLGQVRDARFIEVLGRGSEVVKIGGELVSLTRLDRILAVVMHELRWKGDAAVVVAADQRLGKVIHLVVAGEDESTRLLEEFNRRVLPFERARLVREVREIPRSALGKLLRADL
jgi:O-succinylbenzoic acid--CoA ligase